MSRSYGQYCGLARALDVVGDRWNLLIVRQLLIAPARYRELQDGLPGMATNLLADRLRDLEAAGVVERRLAEQGNAITYALTPWGAELREPVESLIRWSTPLMTRGPGGDHFSAGWLVVALRALFAGRKRARRSSTVGIDVDGDLLQVRMTRSGVEVSPHDGRELDAVLRADASIVLGLAAGVLSLDNTTGLVDVEGDDAAVRAVFSPPSAGM
ncbi:winged helix-turn-helix transcriptional regulator [Lentzea flava]|uniref:Transcriptional regulator n=1 Tax=Lentzea flava TaxID=103732 RepID=A0ABQ2US05_9PSEU|nr:helix-turn-helix domain-containing protein [Lentzea flava]MCP2201140.1 transcriptional regulator, HxlR family [Lentzea flava]GGU48357.1 transcriptional regulator [Lentzea flava]